MIRKKKNSAGDAFGNPNGATYRVADVDVDVLSQVLEDFFEITSAGSSQKTGICFRL